MKPLLFAVLFIALLSSTNAISLIPASLVFNTSQFTPSTQTLMLIAFDENVTQTFVVLNMQGVTVSPTSFASIPKNSITPITVSITPASLPVGTQTGNLQIFSGVDNATIALNATITTYVAPIINTTTTINALASDIIKHIIFKDLTDEDYTITEKVRNDGSVPITITSLNLQPESNWITLGNYDLTAIQPNEETMIPVIIKPSKATKGAFEASLIISAKAGSTVLTPLKITYSITFTGASTPSGGSNANISNLDVKVPPLVSLNTPFVIQVNNLPSGLTIEPVFFPFNEGDYCDQISALWNCVLRSKGVYQLTVRVTDGQRVMATHSKQILAGYSETDLKIGFQPEISFGNSSKLILLMGNDTVFENTKFTIDGEDASTIVPQPGKQYRICAVLSDEIKKCDVLTTTLRTLDVAITPASPAERDTVTLQATDSLTQQTVNATFTVNNAQSPSSFTATSGNLVIQAAALGYETKILSINVVSLPKIVSIDPPTPHQGNKVVILLSEAVPWQVKVNLDGDSETQGNQKIIAEGTSNKIEFYAESGYHSVIANGRSIYTLVITPLNFWETPWFIAIIALIIIAIIIYVVYTKKIRKKDVLSSRATWGDAAPSHVDETGGEI